MTKDKGKGKGKGKSQIIKQALVFAHSLGFGLVLGLFQQLHGLFPQVRVICARARFLAKPLPRAGRFEFLPTVFAN